jgi:hypothetical protein
VIELVKAIYSVLVRYNRDPFGPKTQLPKTCRS